MSGTILWLSDYVNLTISDNNWDFFVSFLPVGDQNATTTSLQQTHRRLPLGNLQQSIVQARFSNNSIVRAHIACVLGPGCVPDTSASLAGIRLIAPFCFSPELMCSTLGATALTSWIISSMGSLRPIQKNTIRELCIFTNCFKFSTLCQFM